MSTTKQKAAAKKRTRKSPGLGAKQKNRLADSKFAFPKERKEPIPDAKHVRNAISRFDQVEDVSDAERDRAWRRIKRAAKRFGVKVSEKSWRELGRPAKPIKSGKKGAGKTRKKAAGKTRKKPQKAKKRAA